MKEFSKKMQEQFDKMCSTGKLFRVQLSGNEIWHLYLMSFEKENNPVFRDPASSEKNCNNCHNFVRRYGNVVAIDENYNTMTIFDVEADDEYRNTAKQLSIIIKKSKVVDVFFETFNELNSLPYESCSKTSEKFQLGMAVNHKQYTKEEAEKFGVVKPDEIRTFNHMHLFLPARYVDKSGSSVESIMGDYRDSKKVFERGMEEISLDTLNLVRDLILQGSLLNGDAHLHKIEQIIPYKQQYDNLAKKDRDNWCWVTAYNMPFAKFKNELIGVLCSELSQGEELNKACQSWNKRVDPANYMKATAPITKKQIEEAKLFVQENGYEDSFDRRCATIEDIKASEIMHINSGDGTIKNGSIFDNVKATATRHKRSEFEGLEEVTIEKFMEKILPTCTALEAYVKNSHEKNMVTLTTARNPDSKPIFKWSNNYSYTFNGNLAGKSEIKESVAAKGGKVDGVLRFSLGWAEGDPSDNSDLDAHAEEPNGTRINFNTYQQARGASKTSMSGILDLDVTNPAGQCAHKNVVENIVWSDLKKMKDGTYKFLVHCYADRGSKGFKAEIEFNGEIYTYEYNQKVVGYIPVAIVTLKGGEFSIKHVLPETGVSSKEIYGLESNCFHKVNLVCLSPNHWGDNKVGNKHYFFMLDGCKSPTSIRGFHNENLISDLLKHRKVMEVLGATNNIPSTDKQLSGLGFNATVTDELIVKVAGTHKRMLKIKF